MRYRLWCCLLLLLGCGMAFAATQRLFYTGTVGTAAVQMELSFTGDTVEGWYYYESVGERIALQGTRARTGAVTLDESLMDREGKTRVTGTFSGTIGGDLLHGEGTWRNPDQQRTLPFALTAVAAYRFVHSARTTKRGFAAELRGCYPVFLSPSPAFANLTRRQQAWVASAQQRFLTETMAEPFSRDYPSEQDFTIEIYFYAPDLVSMLASECGMVNGMAHPYFNNWPDNYLVGNERPTELSLSQLLRPGFQETLSTLFLAALNKEKAARGLLTDSPTQLAIADIPAYVMTPTAMRFSYIGVFVEGIYEVPLPYTQLAAIINPTGALVRFLPKQ